MEMELHWKNEPGDAQSNKQTEEKTISGSSFRYPRFSYEELRLVYYSKQRRAVTTDTATRETRNLNNSSVKLNSVSNNFPNSEPPADVIFIKERKPHTIGIEPDTSEEEDVQIVKVVQKKKRRATPEAPPTKRQKSVATDCVKVIDLECSAMQKEVSPKPLKCEKNELCSVVEMEKAVAAAVIQGDRCDIQQLKHNLSKDSSSQGVPSQKRSYRDALPFTNTKRQIQGVWSKQPSETKRGHDLNVSPGEHSTLANLLQDLTPTYNRKRVVSGDSDSSRSSSGDLECPICSGASRLTLPQASDQQLKRHVFATHLPWYIGLSSFGQEGNDKHKTLLSQRLHLAFSQAALSPSNFPDVFYRLWGKLIHGFILHLNESLGHQSSEELVALVKKRRLYPDKDLTRSSRYLVEDEKILIKALTSYLNFDTKDVRLTPPSNVSGLMHWVTLSNIICSLLQRGRFNVSTYERWTEKNIYDSPIPTPLHAAFAAKYAAEFWKSIDEDNITALAEIIAVVPDMLKSNHPSTGYSPVSYSLGKGKYTAATILLLGGADVDTRDVNGGTSVLRATRAGDSRAVQMLLAWRPRVGLHQAMDAAKDRNDFCEYVTIADYIQEQGIQRLNLPEKKAVNQVPIADSSQESVAGIMNPSQTDTIVKSPALDVNQNFMTGKTLRELYKPPSTYPTTDDKMFGITNDKRDTTDEKSYTFHADKQQTSVKTATISKIPGISSNYSELESDFDDDKSVSDKGSDPVVFKLERVSDLSWAHTHRMVDQTTERQYLPKRQVLKPTILAQPVTFSAKESEINFQCPLCGANSGFSDVPMLKKHVLTEHLPWYFNVQSSIENGHVETSLSKKLLPIYKDMYVENKVDVSGIFTECHGKLIQGFLRYLMDLLSMSSFAELFGDTVVKDLCPEWVKYSMPRSDERIVINAHETYVHVAKENPEFVSTCSSGIPFIIPRSMLHWFTLVKLVAETPLDKWDELRSYERYSAKDIVEFPGKNAVFRGNQAIGDRLLKEIERGNIDCVWSLLKSNPGLARSSLPGKVSLLQCAIRGRRHDIATLLLLCGASIESENSLGYSPLEVAAYAANFKGVELCLRWEPCLTSLGTAYESVIRGNHSASNREKVCDLLLPFLVRKLSDRTNKRGSARWSTMVLNDKALTY